MQFIELYNYFAKQSNLYYLRKYDNFKYIVDC